MCLEPGQVAGFNQERIDPKRARSRSRKDDTNGRDRSVADQVFLTIEAITACDNLRGCRDSSRVRACRLFRECEKAPRQLGGEALKEPVLLFIVSDSINDKGRHRWTRC